MPRIGRRIALRPVIDRLGGRDLTVDLGRDIGSPQWLLGAGALASLCTMAVALGLQAPVLPASPVAAYTPAANEQMHAEAIAPLALGGVTGQAAVSTARVEALAEAPERPRVEISTRLGGNGFAGALRRAGVGKDDMASVDALLRGVVRTGALPGATGLDIVLGRRESKSVPRPLESLGFRAAFDLRVVVQRGDDGALKLKRIPIAVDDTPLRLSGSVGRNMAKTVRSSGVPAGIAAEFVRQLSYAVDFQHGVGAKDRWELVVEHRRAETGETETGDLLYAALQQKGHDKVELARFNYGGKPQFFRANGESARKGLMRTPVDGARLTSSFGMRFHPILNYSRMHQGIDFGAEWGSPVMAAASGKVSFAGVHGGHGNYIMVQHNKELATAYAHLSRFAVKPGQTVGQGQVIGYVGSTGLSTGPHLHYEVWLRGQAVNPQNIKFLGGTQLAGAEMARFQGELNRLRRLAGSEVAAADTPKGRRRT